MFEFTRRRTLATLTAAIGFHGTGIRVPVGLRKLPLGATAFTPQAIQIFRNLINGIPLVKPIALHIACLNESKFGFFDPFNEFSHVCQTSTFIMRFSPPERHVLLSIPEIKALLGTKMRGYGDEVDGSKLCFERAEDILDDEKIIQNVVLAWHRFKESTREAKKVVEILKRKEEAKFYPHSQMRSTVDIYPDDPDLLINSWQDGSSPHKSPFITGERRHPSWWAQCTEHEKLLVWLECRALDLGIPSGKFVPDIDRLIEITRLKLPEIARRNKECGQDFFPPEFFRKFYGPETWRQQFLFSHEVYLRASGMHADEARRQAQATLQSRFHVQWLSPMEAYLKNKNDRTFNQRSQCTEHSPNRAFRTFGRASRTHSTTGRMFRAISSAARLIFNSSLFPAPKETVMINEVISSLPDDRRGENTLSKSLSTNFEEPAREDRGTAVRGRMLTHDSLK